MDALFSLFLCWNQGLLVLQVEDERDAQLQPGADHAQRRGAQTQPRRQHHEGEAHLLG